MIDPALPANVTLILCCFFSLYLLVLSCVCSYRRRTGLDRRAAEDRRAAWARSNVLAPAHPWRPVEPTLPLALQPVEPWPGAAPVVRKELRSFPYSGSVEGGSWAASREKLVCAICLEAFVYGATCSEVTACRHLFHRDCIAMWTRSKRTCPLCRATIVLGSQRLSAAEDMV